ncbi:hypothetical protein L227DRAFT_289484 [Lentinus tigrinus ALCF2SS1-6]|uniref:Uncharacterized protein n=1 Tax=Lentinus tigrinus ALCF2SS1-6 TaxID=1328759 RepID=A0A5C2RXZ1_9APHY|nr:hypothetical protein L227DRAFT_289484 [Lentinus tigrinus ALCF2SS1-6]
MSESAVRTGGRCTLVTSCSRRGPSYLALRGRHWHWQLLMIVLGPLFGAPARYTSQTETPSESQPVLLHRWRARKARSSTTARYEPVGGQRSVTRDRRGGFAGLWFGGPGRLRRRIQGRWYWGQAI